MCAIHFRMCWLPSVVTSPPCFCCIRDTRDPAIREDARSSCRLFRLRRLNGQTPNVPALKAEKNVIRFVGHVLQQFGADRSTDGARGADHGIPQAHRLSIACKGRITTVSEQMMEW